MRFVLQLKVQINLLFDIFPLATDSATWAYNAAAIESLSIDHCFIKAKFHYASCGWEPAPNMFGASSELAANQLV